MLTCDNVLIMEDKTDSLSLLNLDVEKDSLPDLDRFMGLKNSDSVYEMPFFQENGDVQPVDGILKENQQQKKSETELSLKKSLGDGGELISHDRLSSFFVSVFADFSFTFDYTFNENEFKIANSLFKRKFNRPLHRHEHGSGYLVLASDLKAIVQRKFQRKQEECFKYILTRIYRILRHKHKGDFLQKFFGEEAKTNGIDIKYYHLPSTSHPLYKNFNYSFLRSLLRSRLFLEEAVRILNEDIVHLHVREVKKKLRKKFSYWLDATDDSMKRYQLMLDNIKDKHKFILPWTFFELNYAKQLFLNFCHKDFGFGLKEQN